MKLTERSNSVTALLSQPAGWLALALIFLFADYLTGEAIAFPIAFVLPVFLAAWNMRKRWAVGLAVGLPLLRLAMVLVWEETFRPPLPAVLNMLIRGAVLLVLAVITWRYREIAEEVKALKSLLPICMHCRRIRDEHQQWQPLESYLSSHSETKLSYCLCAECAQKYYPESFATDSDAAPSGTHSPGDAGAVS
jgi:hypothetical protein